MSGPTHTPARRTARRPSALLVLLCIGLGLATNIAVVMACAYARATAVAWSVLDNRPWHLASVPELPGKAAAWPVPPPAGWPAAPTVQAAYVRGLWADHRFTHYDLPNNSFRCSWSIALSEFGWPARSASFWHASVYELPRGSFQTTTHSYAILSPVPVSLGFAGWTRWDVEMPLHPLWPGLIANTVFYSVIAYLALLAARSHRGFLRTRRGLCPACAYPRQGLAPATPCPECGRAPRVKSAAA